MWFGNIKDRILFEDKDILVCQKPAGIAVQSAGIGSMDLESMLKNYLAEKAPGGIPYLAVVHRLDQPVEGILVFAKNQKAAAQLNRQMTSGKIKKEYLAVTDRKPLKDKGQLTDYLKKDGRTNTSSVEQKGTDGAKEARLSYVVLETGERTLLKIHLDTGRHHQIRVQLAHAKMPLLGDKKYGGSDFSKGLALCAAGLSFCHPTTGKPMSFYTCPEGAAFQEFTCLKQQFV